MLHQPFQIGAEVSLQILQINAEVLLLFVLCKQFAMWVWLKKTVSDLLIIFFQLYYYYYIILLLSSIYARFCVFLGRGPAASNQGQKTSVAGTATQDSGHNGAQRGQNPGITFAWAVKSANSTSLPCLILLQIVKMPAIQY